MPIQLLPPDFDEQANRAVRHFWTTRTKPNSGRQGGTRDAAVGGKNMDGFADLVRAVAVHCGLPEGSVHTRRSRVVVPGYFRATKNWDVLVLHGGRLLAVLEFKSQVGSIGKNGNNRTDEVIGAAEDLRVAHLHGAFSELRGHEDLGISGDPRPPFVGWMMLLEETEAALAPVRIEQPHYNVFPEFLGASYAVRYRILCERLVQRQLYGGAALVLTTAERSAATGEHWSLSDATSLRSLFTELAARVAAAASGGP